MRLKSIEMQGFKSFPDKTKINFDNGVTAIIGPNGSGKSNISDAVRWVLGEMSLKSLRGSRMEDVIFNGASGRKPSNFSSVSIAFDTEEEFIKAQNSKTDTDTSSEAEDNLDKKTTKKLMIKLGDTKEVIVSRKYYRSGESEYYINKKQVRLKDIYELFYDTGIGREGYSVIGQGKIAEVLSQKGDERRSIFEEAAGISKIRYKKTQAERRLKETELNLVRINDILSEITTRIGPLEKEAENAKQYLVLSEEKKGLEITLWLNRIDAVKEALGKGEIEYNSAKYELEQSEERVKTLENTLDNIINENYELARILSETERKKSDAGQRSGGIESRKAVLINDITHFKRIAEENEQAVVSANANIMSTSGVLNKASETAEALNKEIEAVSQKAEEVQAEYEKIHENSSLLQSQLEESDKNYLFLRDKSAESLSEGAKIDAELELANRSKTGVDENISTSEQRIKELESKLEKLKLSELSARKDYEIQINQKSESEKNIAKQRSNSENLREKIVSQRLSLASAEQKKEHLTRLEQLLEGYSQSVRSIISDAKKGRITYGGNLIGLHGTVSSLISTDGDYVIALETALAAAVQFIVVENEKDAKAAIEYLKRNRKGRATFLPLTTVKGRKCDVTNIKNITGYIGIASELAKYDKKYQDVIDNLLGRTVIATDIDAATKIAEKSRYRLKIVTCDGQVINPGGSFTGGSSAKKVGLLTRSVDIERLTEEIKKKKALLSDSERSFSVFQKQIAQEEKKLSEVVSVITDIKISLDTLLSEKNTISVRLDEEKKRRESLISGKNADDSRLAVLLQQKEKYLLSSKSDEEKLEAAKSFLTEIKEKAESARIQEAEAYEKLNAVRMSLYEKRSSSERQNEQVRYLSEQINNYKNQISEYNNTIQKAKTDISECDKQINMLESEKNSVSDEINVFVEKIQTLLSDREKKEKQINDTRLEVKRAQADKEEAFRRFTSLESKQAKLDSDYENITSKLWDEYELTYSSAEQFRLSDEKMGKAQSRLASLKKRIRAMGSINVNAVEEYKQEKERFDFLTLQTDDLNKSRRSLDNAISKLNTEMKQTFLECFGKINIALGEVFKKLFGGGSAYIELTEPEAPLECGIDIILKPPGKSVRSISLLSGGEQSFAAIALYLALQKINPAPFCIFDEIESALDDINVAKFADFVKENSDKTQYILITHRRGTMERADTLYGITMQKKGISEYIKLDVSKLEENIKEYTN